jgi:hypothetical protein
LIVSSAEKTKQRKIKKKKIKELLQVNNNEENKLKHMITTCKNSGTLSKDQI